MAYLLKLLIRNVFGNINAKEMNEYSTHLCQIRSKINCACKQFHKLQVVVVLQQSTVLYFKLHKIIYLPISGIGGASHSSSKSNRFSKACPNLLNVTVSRISVQRKRPQKNHQARVPRCINCINDNMYMYYCMNTCMNVYCGSKTCVLQ